MRGKDETKRQVNEIRVLVKGMAVAIKREKGEGDFR